LKNGKKILIISTGGTILMERDDKSGVKPIEGSLGVLSKISKYNKTIIDSISLFQIPSPHINEKHMLSIVKTINENNNKYDSFIVLHGTDTVEETAYFVDYW
jgi:L-asparaginase